MIQIYDTTLRDGAQMHGIWFSVADKLKICKLLSELGVAYIEGGWPGANPKDGDFFRQARDLDLGPSKLVAFGSTMRASSDSPEQDPILRELLVAETTTITIVGKSWRLHVEEALRASPERNLEMIRDSVRYLREQGREVIFDCEHFFDGFEDDGDYALSVLRAAYEGGASCLTMCDTNGGTLPYRIAAIVGAVRKEFPVANLGIHTHNDSGVAVANSLAAVAAGANQVQGTINGYGERCGNCDLVATICDLQLKMGYTCLPSSEYLAAISKVSHRVSEIANFNPNGQHPYVGRYAFTHKGGLHASAMSRNRLTYEHVDPAVVGNTSRILVSEQSGLSNISSFATSRGLDLDRDTAARALEDIKRKESLGYQFEQASASLMLLLLHHLDRRPTFFEVIGFRVFSDGHGPSEASVRLSVDNRELHTASLGVGPGHALDGALRKALSGRYEALESFQLTDFKVRVVDSQDGTAAKTRVSVETTSLANGDKWYTVGVDANILRATFRAIGESIEYGLYLAGETG